MVTVSNKSAEQTRADGFPTRILDEHNYLYVARMTFGKGRLYRVYDEEIEDQWCYETYAGAIAALTVWNPSDESPEPEGWMRHPTSGRRRPDGDKTKEYINR